MNDLAEDEGREDDLSAREGRSPGYPFIPLNQALERARALRAGAKGNDVRVATAGTIWELGAKSSALRQTIAALKHFGLVEYIGTTADRKIKLTETASRIVLDERPGSVDRDTLIKKAALTPKIHAELWEKWGTNLPPDVEMQTELILERKFSKTGAADAIAVYKATLIFANLIIVGMMPDGESDKLERSTSQTQSGNPRVAPLVPRTSQQAAIEERIVFKPGQEIVMRFAAEPDVYTYKSLIAYLEFRLKQKETSDDEA